MGQGTPSYTCLIQSVGRIILVLNCTQYITGDTTPLDTFISFVTDVNVKPPRAGTTKNVLVYWDCGWDRGNLTKGDEARMLETGIDS